MANYRSLVPFGIVLAGMAVFGGLRPSTASAQSSVRAFGFGAPGAATCCGESQSILHAGGGAERLFRDGIGIGGEVGFLGPFEYFSEGLWVASVNGSYHFLGRQPRRRLRPFVTAGYSNFSQSLVAREGQYANLWNVGGGVDYWMKPRVGLRVELRDHIHSQGEGAAHFWGPRIGIVIR